MVLNLENLKNWGLTCWMPLTSQYGSTYTPDISGNSHHATVTNGTLAKIKNGSKVHDFTSGYAIFDASGTDFTFSGDFTVCIWFYPDTTPSSGDLFTWIASSTEFLIMLVSATNLRVYSNTTNTDNTVPTMTGAWHHVAVRRIGSTITMFYDGEALPVTKTDSGEIAGANTARLAAYATSQYFDGKEKDFMVFKGTGLSNAQIKALYDAQYIA